jgi:hypothetical protein
MLPRALDSADRDRALRDGVEGLHPNSTFDPNQFRRSYMHPSLDLPTVQALGKHSTRPCIQACATAWLSAYHLARHLAFTEAVALCQANAAWDDTAGWWRRADEEEPSYEVTESGRQALAIGR